MEPTESPLSFLQASIPMSVLSFKVQTPKNKSEPKPGRRGHLSRVSTWLSANPTASGGARIAWDTSMGATGVGGDGLTQNQVPVWMSTNTSHRETRSESQAKVSCAAVKLLWVLVMVGHGIVAHWTTVFLFCQIDLCKCLYFTNWRMATGNR